MKKPKICIVGDGLSGLFAAQILGDLDIDIDLISKKILNKNLDKRTTAISPSNYKFISKYFIKKNTNIFFECKKIELFYEQNNNEFINFMNFENLGKNLMLIFENEKMKKNLISNIKKNKKIKIVSQEIKEINTKNTSLVLNKKIFYYDLILLCIGKNNNIIETLLGKRFIKDDKNEIAYACKVVHNSNLKESKQYFLKEGPMALLPINNKKFSLIWSMNSSYKSFNNNQIKKLILSRLRSIFPQKTKLHLSKINYFPIYFKFNKNFFKNNIFAIGESVYNVYPIAGQGFNLVLRDIEQLYKKINTNISLGIQIKDSSILNDLYLNRKPENFLYSLGIDLTQKFFRYNNFTSPIKNAVLKDLDRLPFLKKIGLKIADKGILNK